MTASSMISPTEGGIVVAIHAVPGARRAQVTGTHGGALKIRVAAPPVAGAANRAVEEALAHALGVAASKVAVVGGSTSQRKRVKVEGIDEPTARRAIDALLEAARGESER